MPLIDIPIALALGFLGGSYGTIVGIGGGILFVPFLLLFLNASPQHAVGTSIAIVFFNALSGAYAYMKQGRVDLRSGLLFASAIVPATILGAWLSRYLSSTILSIIVAILLIASSLFIFFSPVKMVDIDIAHKTRRLKDHDGHLFSYSPRVGLGIFFSLLIGVTYGLLGVGGGIILVPLMVFALGFPPHIATATSQFILAISAFFGTGSHLALGNILYLPAITMAIAAIPGAQLGAYISRKLKASALTRMLALAMTILGVRMLVEVF